MGKNTQQKTATGITREFSSGGVVFKKGKGGVLWLVAKNNPSELYPEDWWRLPKGWIGNKEDTKEAALREVREEGGVQAKIVSKVGTIKFFFNSKDRGRILKFVTFYLMEWEKDLPEGFDFETSEVLWLPFSQAYERLSFAGEKEILKKAKDLLPL